MSRFRAVRTLPLPHGAHRRVTVASAHTSPIWALANKHETRSAPINSVRVRSPDLYSRPDVRKHADQTLLRPRGGQTFRLAHRHCSYYSGSRKLESARFYKEVDPCVIGHLPLPAHVETSRPPTTS